MIRLILLFMLLGKLFLVQAQEAPGTSEAQQKQLKLAEKHLKTGAGNHTDAPRLQNGIRVTFYNVENLFDTEDDPKTRDDDFTPRGLKGWSYRRYKEKLNHIYKTLMALGGWEAPAVVGFCELENKKVLEDLIAMTPLRKFGYSIVHEDSPDRRGIDVGFIYRKSKFKYISHDTLRINMPFSPDTRTRDVLQITGQVLGKDTLNLFVNHWPSRRGGQAKSEPKRAYVASRVRQRIDKIYATNPKAKIVVMGDMNDHAYNKSLIEVLEAKGDLSEVKKGDLYNYMFAMDKNWQMGSHKYQGSWGTLDHIIVSEPLLNDKTSNKLRASAKGAQIFSPRFLMEEDVKFMGLQPYRTYSGPRYIGGFSDHLPIYVDLMFN